MPNSIVLAGLLIVGASLPAQTTASPPWAASSAASSRAVPFAARASAPLPGHVESMFHPPFARARFDGVAAVRPNGRIEVVVPHAAVAVRAEDDAQYYRDLRVSLAVAAWTPDHGWSTAAVGDAVALTPLLGAVPGRPGSDTTLSALRDTLRLSVAVPRGVPLARAWLAFQLKTTRRASGERESVSVYVHTDTLVFAGLGPR